MHRSTTNTATANEAGARSWIPFAINNFSLRSSQDADADADAAGSATSTECEKVETHWIDARAWCIHCQRALGSNPATVFFFFFFVSRPTQEQKFAAKKQNVWTLGIGAGRGRHQLEITLLNHPASVQGCCLTSAILEDDRFRFREWNGMEWSGCGPAARSSI